MTKLTKATLSLAMSKCASNAADLISDADLLRKHGRIARAFLLYSSAVEELAKYFMLEIAGRKLASKAEINWTRFWQRIRNHDAKMAQAAVRIESFKHLIEPDLFERAESGMLIWRNVGTAARNSSLYVETEGGKVRGPADIDWSLGVIGLKGLVEALMIGVGGIGVTPSEIVCSFGRTSQSNPNAALQVELERQRAAGISLEEAQANMETAWNLTSQMRKTKSSI